MYHSIKARLNVFLNVYQTTVIHTINKPQIHSHNFWRYINLCVYVYVYVYVNHRLSETINSCISDNNCNVP